MNYEQLRRRATSGTRPSKTPPPTGEFANVATRPYDQQVYGNVDNVKPPGFSWYNGIQFGIERRFSQGFGLPDVLRHGQRPGGQRAPFRG